MTRSLLLLRYHLGIRCELHQGCRSHDPLQESEGHLKPSHIQDPGLTEGEAGGNT